MTWAKKYRGWLIGLLTALIFLALVINLPSLAHRAFFNRLSISLLNSFVGLMAAALLGGWLAIKQYNAQRDRENLENKYLRIREDIEKRYLGGGLEQFISYLNQTRREVEDNYVMAISTLQRLRDLEQDDFAKWFLSSGDLRQNTISASMPDSLLIVASFIKDEFFVYISVKMLAVSSAINQLFIIDIPRMISQDLEDKSNYGIFAVKKSGNRKRFNEALNNIKDELTRRDMEIRPLYNHLLPALEGILIRFRILELKSYEEFFQKAKDDPEILEYYKSFKAGIINEIDIYLEMIEDYKNILKKKGHPEIDRYEKEVLEPLVDRAKVVISQESSSNEEIILIEKEVMQQATYLRTKLYENGFA